MILWYELRKIIFNKKNIMAVILVIAVKVILSLGIIDISNNIAFETVDKEIYKEYMTRYAGDYSDSKNMELQEEFMNYQKTIQIPLKKW